MGQAATMRECRAGGISIWLPPTMGGNWGPVCWSLALGLDWWAVQDSNPRRPGKSPHLSAFHAFFTKGLRLAAVIGEGSRRVADAFTAPIHP